MLFEVGQYRVDVEVEKTKQFYQNADAVSKSCSCDGCRNFEKAVDTLPPFVTAFFADLGIDMKKACECYVNCAGQDGLLLYGGFYHVCGTLLDGQGAWQEISENTFYWNNDAAFCISPDFNIAFQEDIALLEQDFPLPVLQLEFLAKIPWVLKKDNPYL